MINSQHKSHLLIKLNPNAQRSERREVGESPGGHRVVDEFLV